MPTYRIDEGLLRNKLQGYTVEINAERCQAIEADIANLRFKKTFDLPKVNFRIVAPAAAIVVVVLLVLFNLDALSALFASAPEVKKPEIKTSVPETKPAATSSQNTQTVAAASVTQPTMAVVTPPTPNNIVAKTDSAKNESSRQESAKKPNPVMAQPPSDSAAKVSEPTKRDTSVQRSEPVKKKKRRRRRNSGMDDLKESTLQSGGADDDVVVPQ